MDAKAPILALLACLHALLPQQTATNDSVVAGIEAIVSAGFAPTGAGGTVLVARDDRVLFRRAYGYAIAHSTCRCDPTMPARGLMPAFEAPRPPPTPYVMAYTHVLEALADPTRRLLFESLRRGEHTVGELADLARIRQPTASQHLQTLREARLVTDRRDGTRRFYSADPAGLVELRDYLESFWDGVLAAYAGQDRQPASVARRRRASAKSLRRRRR